MNIQNPMVLKNWGKLILRVGLEELVKENSLERLINNWRASMFLSEGWRQVLYRKAWQEHVIWCVCDVLKRKPTKDQSVYGVLYTCSMDFMDYILKVAAWIRFQFYIQVNRGTQQLQSMSATFDFECQSQASGYSSQSPIFSFDVPPPPSPLPLLLFWGRVFSNSQLCWLSFPSPGITGPCSHYCRWGRILAQEHWLKLSRFRCL